MEKKQIKENISERSDNPGSKSLLSRNNDNTHNSLLLSSDVSKKTSDKKVGEIKPLSERSINKKIKKQLENDSYSWDNSKFEPSNDNKQKKKTIMKKKEEFNKIIVDDIQNIYSCITNKSNYKFMIQKILLLLINCLVYVCHWIFLFINIQKLERNYCFTSMNQFDSCSEEQICKNYPQSVNIILFNDTLNVLNNSKTFHQNFLDEFTKINEYYKSFFVNHFYQISKNKLFASIDMISYDSNRLNAAIILSKREQWNIFFKFFSLCQKQNYYFWGIFTIAFASIIGSLIFGILADILGRKKIIIINLFIVSLAFSLLSSLMLNGEYKYDYYLKEYTNKYNSSENNNAILSLFYAQQKISKDFENDTVKYLAVLFILCLALRPLDKICLALLLEDSSSELKVLENYRLYTFIVKGIPPIFTFIITVFINDIFTTIIIVNALFVLYFFMSLFFINESIRWHYEYCEWKELTSIIHKLFKLEENTSITYKNKMEYELYRFQETKRMIGNLEKKINFVNKNNITSGRTIFNLFKQRVIALKRDIRRNCEVVIKKEEIRVNPIIIYTCLTSNRVFNKSKYLFLMILTIIYCQIHFVEKELMDVPFLKLKDLYFDFHNNYIINSNYFILMIITLISNFLFYMFYRINCFKMILYFSLIFVTILFILYHYLTISSKEYPLDINQVSFSMVDQHFKMFRKNNTNALILIIFFFMNGINFYINLLILKLTKTIYRCTLFGFNTCLSLLSLAFGENLNYHIENYFFLIGSLNIVGIVTILYFGELKTVPYIINDLKQNMQREKRKNK